MTPRDDRFHDMPPCVQFDAAIEQALRGDAVGDDVATFARFVDDVRVMADQPPPSPSPALAALLAGSAATRKVRSTVVPRPPRTRSLPQARLTQPTSRRSRPAWIRMRVAAVPIAGKAAVLLAVATTATAGAATGVLPESGTHFVRRAIEMVTPFELPGDDDARSEHADQRVDHPSAAGIDPDAAAVPPAASRPAASRPAAIAAGAGDTHDPGVEANADPQREPNPADEASSGSGTYPAPEPSAWPTTPGPPASSPPQSKGPKKAAPPDAGSPTEPGPKTGHVPPGHASPGTPGPGGLSDPDPTTDRPAQLLGKGRPARPRPAPGSSSNPAREPPQHGSPPAVGHGTGTNEEPPPSAPPPAAEHGPSARGSRDHGHCRQSRTDAHRPAECDPGAPRDPGRGPRADTGAAQAVDAAEPEPPTP